MNWKIWTKKRFVLVDWFMFQIDFIDLFSEWYSQQIWNFSTNLKKMPMLNPGEKAIDIIFIFMIECWMITSNYWYFPFLVYYQLQMTSDFKVSCLLLIFSSFLYLGYFSTISIYLKQQ